MSALKNDNPKIFLNFILDNSGSVCTLSKHVIEEIFRMFDSLTFRLI